MVEHLDRLATSRRDGNAVLLPDGKVLAVGGEGPPSTQNWSCEIFDPATNSWALADSLDRNRGHHSFALLLPDGRVFASGHENAGQAQGKNYQLYYPPYLFDSAGSWAERDTILTYPEPATASVAYGLPFEITVKDSAGGDIDEVVLMRPSAVTHATDFSQTRILLSHTVVPGDSARLVVSGPKDSTYAPAGYYMLIVLDGGVPSEAKWVKVQGGGSYVVADGDSVRWGGDVWLAQDFVVQSGGKLTILPGTTVHAQAGAGVDLLTQGQLVAEGTAGSPILFTSMNGTGAAGEWGGLGFELAGNVSSGYGFVGALEPISRVSHARIENADVGVRIKDLVAPGLADVTFQNCATGGGAVTRDILLDQSDVVLPWGVWNTAMYSDVEEDRVVWDLEAPANVVATNTVTPGKNHPTATLGDTTKVDLFIDGGLLTRNEAGPAAFVWFRPFSAVDSLGTGWGGIEVHSYAKGTSLRYARVSHAEDPLYFAYPESCTVANSQVHHYANYGIRVLGGSNNALTVESTLIARGPGLGAARGIWGIHAEEVPSLRVLNSQIYDYSYGVSDGWIRGGVSGGGIRVANDSAFCATTLVNADSVVFRGNALVGPGESYTDFQRSAVQLDWSCGSSNRDVAIHGNGIIRWFHGLKVDESRDTDVRCNRVKDNRIALEFYRDTQPTSDPAVRFKENQFVSSGQRTIYVDEGMEHAALGSASSTSDRGLNRFVLDGVNDFYVHQFDSTYTSEVLHAEQNQWHDGTAETAEADIRGQSLPNPDPLSVRDRIEADSPITTSYTISCLPGVPDTLAPALGVISEVVRTLAGARQESAPDGDRDPAVALAAVPGADLPAATELLGVRPNPARVETALRFAVGRDEIHPIRLAVFDVRGRRVATLLDGVTVPGVHEVSWNGVDEAGQRVAAGVYFLRFEAGAVSETRKIVHLR